MLASGAFATLFAAGLAGVTLAGWQPVPAQAQVASKAPVQVLQDTVVGTYSNAQINVKVTKKVTGSGTNKIVSYVADITATSASALRSAFARNTYGQNITEPVSTIAANNNAILAINSDYYGFRDDGIVIRNGVAYRDKGARQGLGILRDGGFYMYDETKTNASALLAANVWHGLSFGPHLIQNGQILPDIDKYEIGDFGPVWPGGPGSIQGNQPRTGIGLVANNHYVMIVVDGRGAGGSRGANMTEFAQMFIAAGAKAAYNLDGGGSATMYFNGKNINIPAMGSERATSDILYFAK